MSTAVKRKLNATQAAAEAAQVLDLPDTRKVSTALTEAALEELQSNPAFAQRIRGLYAEQTATTVRKRGKTKDLSALAADLVPVKRVEGRAIDPAAPLDPYFLHEVYGTEQLPIALELFSMQKLREAAAVVQQRNPGTKPASRARKGALVEYILQYVAFM